MISRDRLSRLDFAVQRQRGVCGSILCLGAGLLPGSDRGGMVPSSVDCSSGAVCCRGCHADHVGVPLAQTCSVGDVNALHVCTGEVILCLFVYCT